MGKRTRTRKISLALKVEGQREAIFVKHIQVTYSESKLISSPDNPNANGGTPDKIISDLLRETHKMRAVVWIDEDKEISQETRDLLAAAWKVSPDETDQFNACSLRELQERFNSCIPPRKPILIVSHPLSVEGFLIRLLGKAPCHTEVDCNNKAQQVTDLKNSYNEIRGSKMNDCDFFEKNFPKNVLESLRAEFKELDLLIGQLTTG